MFQLVELTGWTVEEIDRTPAVRLDRLLSMASVKGQAENRRAQKEQERHRRGR